MSKSWMNNGTKINEKRILPSIFIYLTVFALLLLVVGNVGAALPTNPTAPVLGEVSTFVILTSQTITTTGTTAIRNGNIGIEDQARSYYAGFTPGALPGQFTELTNGLSYAHDDTNPALIPSPYASTIAFINQTRTDLTNAYSFLAADPNPSAATQVLPTELGGLTLTRGDYKTASDVTIQIGDLRLDAQGDSNSVWIFTIDGKLTTGAPGGNIILMNGAQAKNIFWRTAGKVTIAAGTMFYGNVFAFQQINVLSGASITGRLISVNEQVTLISDTVVLDETAPTITGTITTTGFTGANPDLFYGPDQNIRIRVNVIDSGSGVASLDVNFYDINGTSVWVRATRVDANTFDINTGHGWNHNFESVTLKIKITDNAGNSTASTALSNSIVLNNSNFPSGLGGATTNFNDVNDFSAVHNLTFEKVGQGKIIFLSDVNLSNSTVLAQLQSIANAITFSTGTTGNRTVNFDTTGFNGKLAGISVNVTVFGLLFANKPGLLHESVRCDNNALKCTTSYAGGIFNFTSTLGFSQYDIDGNAPILINATTVGGKTANLSVTSNESATYKYSTSLDKNFDTIIDVNATTASTNPSWLLTDLNNSTAYKYNVWARDLAGNDSNLLVTFTTHAPLAIVNLGSAGSFVVLAKSGVSTTGTTSVVGDIGVSPIDSTGITGFGLIMDSSNTFSTSSLVTGKLYAADYTNPTPATLSTAISDMQTAYTDAAGRILPDATDLGTGDISGMTLSPGLYKWGTGVIINNGVTLDCQGDVNAVYIFQIAQTLTVGNGAIVTLSGGCLAKNIFWQVAGQTSIGTTAVFNGTILDQTIIALNTGATLNGRALAQTAVTLIGNNINNAQGTIDTTMPIFDLNLLNPSNTKINDINAIIDINSSEKVTCKYSVNQPVSYASMLQGPTFDSNGLITVYDLSGGTDYNVFVRCRDLAGNDSNGYKSFSFTTALDTTKPVISISSLTKTTSTAQLTVTTNEAVTCRRSITDLNYALMPTDVNLLISTTLGTGSGTINLSALNPNTAYTFFVVCRDLKNNDSNASTAFTTDAPSSDGGADNGGSSGGGTNTVTYVVTSTKSICSSFTYSNWSICSVNNQQTRAVVSSLPNDCVDGNYVLTQVCAFAPVSVVIPTVVPVVTSEPTVIDTVQTPTEIISEASEPIAPVTGLFGLNGLGNLFFPAVLLALVLAALGLTGVLAKNNLKKEENEKVERDKRQR